MQENINIPDSNISANLSFRNLVLMNMQTLTNFPYIEQDFDALTDYQLLCLVVKYLNEVITNSNAQNDSITSLYNAFLELQTYVNNTKDDLETAFNNLDDYVRNYFDNLDVQEEINNKLDQMLEDGVLEQIIEQFLQSTALWCFDTVADMQSATNLVNGSYARTMGYYSINDGGGATYKITNTASLSDIQETLSDDLYATLIIDNELNILQLGAKGDGETDDTTIIQGGITYCETNNIPLYLPGRIYLVNGSLETTGRIKIYGDMRNSMYQELDSPMNYGTVLFTNVDSEYPLLKVSNNRYSCDISNLTLFSDFSERDAIHLLNSGWECTLRNLYICQFKGHAIYMNQQYDSVIENCSFIKCYLDKTNSYKYTIKMTDTSHSDTTNAIHFTNCHFEHSPFMVEFGDSENCQFVSCKFEQSITSSKDNGLIYLNSNRILSHIFSACTFMLKHDNRYCFKDSTAPAIKHINSILVTGCTFVNADNNGFKLIKNQYDNFLFENCFASLLDPVTNYAIDTENANFNNCRFILLITPDTVVRGVSIKNGTFSNNTIGVHNNDLTFTNSDVIPLFVRDNAIIVNTKFMCPWQTNYPFATRYKTGTEAVYGKMESLYDSEVITTSGVYGSDSEISLDMGKHDSNNLVFNKGNTTINEIKNGVRGQIITIFSAGGTLTLKANNATYDGTKIYHAGGTDITINPTEVVRLIKMETQWYVL